MVIPALLLFSLAVTALPSPDNVVYKLDPGPRYQYVPGPDGVRHLVDLWVTTTDIEAAARYNPDVENVYYLFTRKNPTLGQPMILGNAELVSATNYDVNKKTVVLVHGWMSDYASTINTVLVPGRISLPTNITENVTNSHFCSSRVSVDHVSESDILHVVKRLKALSSIGSDGLPAYIIKDCIGVFREPLLHILNLAIRNGTYLSLWKVSRVTPIPKDESRSQVVKANLPVLSSSAFLAAADVNIIVVDWSVGAGHINYNTAVLNTVTSGVSVARFITWFNNVTGSSLSQYHIAGHSLGGHQVGVIGRNLGGQVPYITSLDPAGPGWITNRDRFRPDDGIYTEVVHSNVGVMGYLPPLGQADFYPNGGIDMPGCGNAKCDHDRALFYFGESLSSGGFTGQSCLSYFNALVGSCSLSGTLQMGGLEPKTGQSGIYHLRTNAAPPFSQG